jgi:hypothetical protein
VRGVPHPALPPSFTAPPPPPSAAGALASPPPPEPAPLAGDEPLDMGAAPDDEAPLVSPDALPLDVLPLSALPLAALPLEALATPPPFEPLAPVDVPPFDGLLPLPAGDGGVLEEQAPVTAMSKAADAPTICSGFIRNSVNGQMKLERVGRNRIAS